MKTFGDKRRFALSFECIPDPDQGGTPEARASWARWQIWVGGRNLTTALSATGAVLHAAETPLAAVLDGLTSCWDPLLHEERLPRSSTANSAAAWRLASLDRLPTSDAQLDVLLDDRAAWWRRHALGAALPGYRVPDLQLRRLGDEIEISWDDAEWRIVGGGAQLTESPGDASLPVREVAQVLFDWASALTEALASVDDEAVQAFASTQRVRLGQIEVGTLRARLRWMAGGAVERAARTLRRVAGVTTGDISETVSALLGVEPTAPDACGLVASFTVPCLLFRSAAPGLSSSDLTTLVELASHAVSGGERLQGYVMRSKVPTRLSAITEDGIERAHALRAHLKIGSGAALTGQNDLESTWLPRLGVRCVDVRLDDTEVGGVAVWRPGHQPTIAVNRSNRASNTPWGRRMTVAHELCHLLHDQDEQGQVGVVSGGWAAYRQERRANAFAVTLVAPEDAILSRLPEQTSEWTAAQLRRVMEDLGMGRTTLLRQLVNLGRISESDRQVWAEEI